MLIAHSGASRFFSFGSSLAGGADRAGRLVQVAPDLAGVRRPVEPEGPGERAAAFGQVQAPEVGMQVGTPTREPSPQVEDEGSRLPAA
jgi:hypothetical protein